LVNTGLRRDAALEARYLALGSAARISGSKGMAVCLDAGEMVDGRVAGDVYAGQTGCEAPSGSGVCLGFSRLLRANEEPGFKARTVGLLGDAFHRAGRTTAAIGNSDTWDEKSRNGALIAVDSKGLVDSGAISGVAGLSPDAPGGVSDDVDAMVSLASRFLADHGLVVVELGDLSRIESCREGLSEDAYAFHRMAALRKLNGFMMLIRPAIERHQVALVICSPCRMQTDETSASNLAPIVVRTPGGRRGILRSATTRMDGLISNIDVAPTILRAGGLPVPAYSVGLPAETVAARNPAKRLERMEAVAVRNHRLQVLVLVLVTGPGILSASISEIVFRTGKLRRMRKVLGAGLLAGLSAPAAMLLTDGADVAVGGYVLRLVLTAVAVLAMSYGAARIASKWIGRPVHILAALYAITSVLILADVFTGARLLRWSITSCAPIVGIRYYGLGNEYMGILVGMGLVGPMLVWRSGAASWCRIALTGWFALVAWGIGYPSLGANVGGLVTAVAAFGTALALLSGRKLRLLHAIGLAAIALAAVASFAGIDAAREGLSGSHLGRCVSFARMYGWEYIGSLMAGKVMMHLGILKLPQAYLPLIFSLPFFVLYSKRMRTETARREDDMLYRAAMPAALVGMVVALLVNDSGIVPAALIFSMFAASAVYLRLEEAEA
jgi:hypothetical protein